MLHAGAVEQPLTMQEAGLIACKMRLSCHGWELESSDDTMDTYICIYMCVYNMCIYIYVYRN